MLVYCMLELQTELLPLLVMAVLLLCCIVLLKRAVSILWCMHMGLTILRVLGHVLIDIFLFSCAIVLI